MPAGVGTPRAEREAEWRRERRDYSPLFGSGTPRRKPMRPTFWFAGKDEPRRLSKNELVRLVLYLHTESVSLSKCMDAIEERLARGRGGSACSMRPR